MNRASHRSLWSCVIWFCLVLGFLPCVGAQTTTPVEIPTFPKYIVLGVVYAPPGSSSSVTYGNSTMVGSSDSISTGTSTNNVSTSTTTVGGGFFGFGATTTNSSTSGWASSFTNGTTASVQTTAGNSISTLGPISSSLGANHDNDVIYIWLNPVVVANANVTSAGSFLGSSVWNGLLSNGCDVSGAAAPSLVQRMYGCDPNQYPYPDIVGIPVWCLKNPFFPGQGCAQWQPYTSRSWDNSYRGPAVASQSGAYPENPRNPVGLTLEDYTDILKADPFVQLNQNSANACHPLYGPNLDPNTAEGIAPPPTTAGVISALVTSGGSGYGVTPAVIFTSVNGSGSGATGIANMYNGSVVSVTMTNSGSGYTQGPSVSFSGGSPTVAATASSYLPRLPNSCGGQANTSVSLTRFQPYGTVQYPVPGPNGLPSTYSGTFQYQNTNQAVSSSTDSHTTGSSVGVTAGFSNSLGISVGGVSFNLASFDASFGTTTSQSSTFQQTSNLASTSQLASSAAYSITGPQLSDNYSGPATYNVYLDNIYHTFAFYSDLEPQVSLGTITIQPGVGAIAASGASNAPIPIFQPTAVGSSTPTVIPITLTNNSSYPLTMVWPAVTFSTGDFQLVEDDPNHIDGCSNQYLEPYGMTSSLGQTSYCTLYVKFTPQSAWNSAVSPTPAVYGTMIAAGTENATPYQNILVTSQQDVEGIVSTVQGATLIASGQSLTQENPIPNLYAFPVTNPGSTSGFSFVFTNNSTSGASVVPQAVTLTDNTNFSVLPTGTCGLGSNTAVAPGSSCTISIQFQPTTIGNPKSLITVSGVYAGTTTAFTPVTAAATGNAGSPITISPTSVGFTFTDTYYENGAPDTFSANPTSGNATITITNISSQSLTLSFSPADSAPAPYLVTNNCGSLGPGASCQLLYSDYEIQGSNANGYELLTVTASQNGSIFAETITVLMQEVYQDGGIGCNPNCVNVIVFQPQMSTQTQTIAAGSTAQYPLSISPNYKSYPAAVYFTATGLPVGATAIFSPATLPANAGTQAVMLTVKTANTSAKLQRPALGRLLSPIMLTVLFLPLGTLRSIRRSRRRLLQFVSLAALFAALASGGVTGCAAGKSASVSQAVAAPQSYTIVVTATSGGASQSTNLYLTIQ